MCSILFFVKQKSLKTEKPDYINVKLPINKYSNFSDGVIMSSKQKLLIDEQLKYFYKHLNYFDASSKEYKVIINGINEIKELLRK